jgi:hypothetical protein
MRLALQPGLSDSETLGGAAVLLGQFPISPELNPGDCPAMVQVT